MRQELLVALFCVAVFGEATASQPAAKQNGDGSVCDLRQGSLDLTCWAKKGNTWRGPGVAT